MKKVLTILVASASLTRGGALVLNGQHMIRNSERIAMGITLPQQAIGRTIKVTVDESKAKTPSGLTFVEIDSSMINEQAAIRTEIVRVYQTALRNEKQATTDEPDKPVAPPAENKPADAAAPIPDEEKVS